MRAATGDCLADENRELVNDEFVDLAFVRNEALRPRFHHPMFCLFLYATWQIPDGPFTNANRYEFRAGGVRGVIINIQPNRGLAFSQMSETGRKF